MVRSHKRIFRDQKCIVFRQFVDIDVIQCSYSLPTIACNFQMALYLCTDQLNIEKYFDNRFVIWEYMMNVQDW